MANPICVHCDLPPDPGRRCPVLSGSEQCIPCETVEERGAITNPITNSAPIERGLVMDADAVAVCTDPDCMLCAAHARAALTDRMRTLARNLRDAAGCALGWRHARAFEESWRIGDCEAWCPNLDGHAAPGWTA